MRDQPHALHPTTVETIFTEALALPPALRRTFIDQSCEGDPVSAARILALLEAHQNNCAFLDLPAAAAALRKTGVVHPPVPDPAPGDRIGRYLLVERIGEGGCGIVYGADQLEPVRRRVALKLIRLGMDTREFIARFEAEQQALALMDHPNIAHVYDAGSTPRGRPYLVMELVRGIAITRFCDEHKLPVRDRLDLFIKVCQAIQHAHQKGVIHRDIKPSNILVTLHDGVPVPKVIDFGIAKATDQRLTDKTLFTQFDSFIGTPAYMSPEQAEMSGLDIDTRTDIYSLGVLLYELLTGVTPFSAQTLAQSSLDEMRRMIREDEPKRPSTRFSALDVTDAIVLAKHREEKVSALTALVRGDLDWIVMKCLEKDRTRRYETANGLVADIRRHLNNEVIVARPPTTGYRMQKAVRRNRVAFAAGTAVAVALVAGIVISSWQAVRAKNAELTARRAESSERVQAAQARADRERAVRAETAAKNAEAATRDELENALAALAFIRDDLLGQASPDRQPDPALTVRKMLDRASAQLDQPTNRPPKVEAALRQTIGSVYFDLGEYGLAIRHLERALALQRQNLGPAHEETLRTVHILSGTHFRNGDEAKSLELAREGLELSRRALGETNLMTLHFLADVASTLASNESGPTEEIDRRIRDALRVVSATLGDTNKLTFRLTMILGMHLSSRGKYREAELVISPALERHRSMLPETDQLMLQMMTLLARVHANLSNLDRAEALYRRILALLQSISGPDHATTVNIEIKLAMIHLKRGEFAQADRTFTRLMDLLAEGRLVEARSVVASLVNLVRFYRLVQEWGKIDALSGAVLTAGREQFQEDVFPLRLVAMYDEWARSLMEQGRYAEAEPNFRRAMEIRTQRNDTHGRRFAAMSRLGDCLFKQNKDFEQAETLLKSAALELEKRIKQIPERIRLEAVGDALRRLADFYAGTGRPAEAAVYKNKLAELENAEGRRLLRDDYLPHF